MKRPLYQQEIKHFYWSFVYMKLYNNSQKTPQSESLHKVKQNRKTPCQKIKVYTANITVSSSPPPASDMAEKTPQTVQITDYREKFPRTKYSSRQLIHTKATRIFLQHQILILYTAWFPKGRRGDPVTRRAQGWGFDFGGKSEEEQRRAAGDGRSIRPETLRATFATLSLYSTFV